MLELPALSEADAMTLLPALSALSALSARLSSANSRTGGSSASTPELLAEVPDPRMNQILRDVTRPDIKLLDESTAEHATVGEYMRGLVARNPVSELLFDPHLL